MNKLVRIVAIVSIALAVGYVATEAVKFGFRIVVAICY
jgi:hypothetical protein